MTRRSRIGRRALRVAAACGLLCVPLLTSGGAAHAAGTAISGGGSSFAALEVDQWRADTAHAPYSLGVNYVSQGSSFGRQQFSSNNLDFGASDIIFQQVLNELKTLSGQRCSGQALANCFVYVPVSAGGVSFMYNLVDANGHRISNLQLTRQQACQIFTGKLTKWNQLAANNPALGSNGNDIVPIIRADGAGESYVFSDFCRQVDAPDWQAFIADRKAHDPSNVAPDFAAGQPVSNWPQNWGRSNPVPFGDGVANAVADPTAGQNAITYTAAGYAKVRGFPVASVQNAAGVYTQPDETNVTVALGYATPQNDPASGTVGTFQLNYSGADPRAYFPSTYSYIIAQTGGWSAAKGATLGQFLCYAISKGQEIAPQLRYARLSAPLVQIAINAITHIPGAPPASSCFVAGAAAPPGAPTVAAGSSAAGSGAASGAGTGTTASAGASTSGSGAATGAATDTGTASGKTGTAGTDINTLLAAERGSHDSSTQDSALTLGAGAALAAGLLAVRRRWGAS